MTPRNRLRFQRGAVYRLKRSYGQPIDIYRQDSEGYDLVTGKKTVTKSKLSLLRAVLLPGRSTTDFQYRLAYLVNNKDFTYGGYYDQTLRDLVIDRKDLSGEFTTLMLTDYIVINHQRYQVKEIDSFEMDLVYWLVIKETAGAPPGEVQTLAINDLLVFRDTNVATTAHTQGISETLDFIDVAGGET
jgi:hypothetical protein